MTGRAAFPAGRVAALALAVLAFGCGTEFAAPGDVGPDDAGSLPEVTFDPGPRDNGPADALRDDGPAADPGADPATDGADVGDPGPTDPGTDGEPPVDAAPEVTLPNGGAEMTPYTLEFGYVQAGGTAKRPLTLKNVGPGDLRVDRFRMTGSADFAPDVGVDATPGGTGVREWVLDPPRVLAEGASWALQVVFAPTAEGDLLSELTVLSSDTDRPGGAPKAFLRGNQSRPCAAFKPVSVDFGAMEAAGTKSVDVKVESCGTMPLEIRGLAPDAAAAEAGVTVDLSQLGGGATPTPEAPVTLAAGASATVRVTWVPAHPTAAGNPLGGRLVLAGNQFFGATFLPLDGTAFQAFCTQPGIRLVGDASVPLNAVLQASGDASVSYFGTVSTWAWDATQPAGNEGAFLPGTSSRDVSIFAGVPGTYTLRLQASDDAGYPSCDEATTTVTVTPRLQAAIVATWHPVSGASPVAGSGPDVDLHVLHPAAPVGDAGWYNGLYDCNPYNDPYPDKGTWGNANPAVQDTVEVSSQSADGLVPEAVTLDMPGCPPGRVFRFGAHHFAAAGTGPAEVTLTVYINGAQALRRTAVLAEKALWDAGTLTCATATEPARADEVPGPRILSGFVPVSGRAR
jgi:hypothetical protein